MELLGRTALLYAGLEPSKLWLSGAVGSHLHTILGPRVTPRGKEQWGRTGLLGVDEIAQGLNQDLQKKPVISRNVSYFLVLLSSLLMQFKLDLLLLQR